jgi:predicted permease
MENVAEQVFSLVLMMAAGFVAAKARVITAENRGVLTDIVLYISSPMLVVSSFQMQYSAELLRNMGAVALFAAASMGAFYFLGLICWPRKDEGKRRVLQQAMLFSNCGFMGFPVLQSLFGETGVVYGSVYVMVFTVFVWTAGIHIYSGKTGSLRQVLLQPGLIAVAVGLLLFLFNFRLPAWAGKAVSGLGSTNTPLAMVIVGALVAEGNFRNVFRDWTVFAGAAARLILLPALSLGALWLLWSAGVGFPVSSVVVSACILLTAMPVAANVAIFASMFKVAPQYAAQTVLVSTLLSVATIPAWIFALHTFFK